MKVLLRNVVKCVSAATVHRQHTFAKRSNEIGGTLLKVRVHHYSAQFAIMCSPVATCWYDSYKRSQFSSKKKKMREKTSRLKYMIYVVQQLEIYLNK